MIDGKLVWLQEEVRKEDISIALIIREQFSTSVLFKDILETISLILCYRTMWWLELEYSLTFTHVGCTFNLHSIINNGLVPGGQNLSRRQTVFFLPVDPRDESHRDPEHIDFSVPRLARYMHSAWKRHQDAVFWVDIDLAIKEGLTFYQTRSNAIILQGTLPAHCISKVERLKTGEMLYERRYLSPRPPPKISLKHDHNWTKGNDQSGSTVEQQPVGKLVQQSFGEAPRAESSKPTQSKPIQSVIERGNPWIRNVFLWRKEKRPIHKRLLVNVCMKNLVLQIERGNPWSVKTIASCMFTIERWTPWNQAQTHTHSARIWFSRTSWYCIIKREQVQFCNRWGKHRLQHLRRAERDGETITWHQRSQLDSADRESPSTTSTSKWSSTTSSIQSFQQRIKRCDYSCWEHWTMRDSRRGAEITVQSMSDVLGRWHRLLHVWTLLARWYNKKYISSVLDLFSIPNFYIRKGRPHGHRCGKKEGCKEFHTTKQLQKRCRKKQYENIHDRFIRDTWFRKTMIELGRSEEVILEMDRLADEDHSHIATEEEIDVYRGNWWIRSNLVDSDTMPTRHRPDFKKALSTLHRLKKAEDKAHYENWSQSSSSWWQWQNTWWHPYHETSPQRWT